MLELGSNRRRGLALLLLLAAVPSRASGQPDAQVRDLQSRVANRALKLLAAERCRQYLGSKAAKPCAKEARAYIDTLGGRVNTGKHHGPFGIGVATYAEDLVSVATDPKVAALLEELGDVLSQSEQPQPTQPLNLFELIAARVPDPRERMRLLSTVFQDVTRKQGHVAYLQNRLKPAELARFQAAFERLRAAIVARPKLELYPVPLAGEISDYRGLYHFYVWLYALQSAPDPAKQGAIAALFEAMYSIMKYHCFGPGHLQAEESAGAILELQGGGRRGSLLLRFLRGCLNRTQIPPQSSTLTSFEVAWAGLEWAKAAPLPLNPRQARERLAADAKKFLSEVLEVTGR